MANRHAHLGGTSRTRGESSHNPNLADELPHAWRIVTQPSRAAVTPTRGESSHPPRRHHSPTLGESSHNPAGQRSPRRAANRHTTHPAVTPTRGESSPAAQRVPEEAVSADGDDSPRVQEASPCPIHRLATVATNRARHHTHRRAGGDRVRHPSSRITDMSVQRPHPRQFHVPTGTRRGDVVEQWSCPVCERQFSQIFRPGRPRLYCRQACRQQAYRWRRDNHVRSRHSPASPLERAWVYRGARHALRSRNDFMSRIEDGRLREVTVCGVLARPARYGRWTHNKFLPEHLWSCLTCSELATGAPPVREPPWKPW